MVKTFRIVGGKNKGSSKMGKVVDFLNSYFTDTSKDLGLKRLNKEFVKYNEESNSSVASSYLSVSEIQGACFLASQERIKSGFDTIVVCDDSNNMPIIKCIEYTEDSFNSYFEKNLKSQNKKKTEVDAMTFITNYMQKHKEELDIDILVDFLKSLKTN